MFKDTWRWVVRFRRSDKNIGVPHYRINEELAVLIKDARYWIENKIYKAEEL
ncbi:MAG: hypothetical protein SFT81_06640 [Candidatus Caenarcaniphilales bacterium]|nr:hypothetical protein [Candidatus Caenarcaniphilales bacterium]